MPGAHPQVSTIALWWNWEIGATDKRSLVGYDH